MFLALILIPLIIPLMACCRLVMRHLSERPAGRAWQGYALCVAMFLALILKSLLFAHSMFLAARVGIRMTSTLITAIYRKVTCRA